MPNSFINGAIAGYAIAIPVGAIAILILETALQRGFAHGFAAGTGTASADLIYATVAATLGTLVAVWLAPIAPLLKILSGIFLIFFGLRGLFLLWRSRPQPMAADSEVKTSNAGLIKTYATFLSLTILNPATIAYFAALIIGGSVSAQPTLANKAVFVVGAFFASWSWQSFLAGMGALAHRHLRPGFKFWTSLVGNFIIILLGVKIMI